jgi:integrase
VFRAAVAVTGLPITRPYDLRHACASLLINAGTPLTEVAEHLGNSVGVLSQTYAHVIKDMRGQSATSVPDAIMSARATRRSRSA